MNLYIFFGIRGWQAIIYIETSNGFSGVVVLNKSVGTPVYKLVGFRDTDKFNLYLNKYYLTINWLKDIMACDTHNIFKKYR